MQRRSAAEARKRRGLDDELPEDVAALGSHRFSDSDLVSALRDRRQHDVHDDDPADYHEDRDDADGDRENRSRQILPGFHQGIGRIDSERVIFAVSKVPVRAQQHPGFVFEFRHVLGIGGLDEDHQLQVRHEEIAKGAERNENKIVLADPEGCADSFRHADHGEVVAADHDLLADGVGGGEELIDNVLTDETDAGVVAVILFADVAAFGNFFAAYHRVAGGDPA